MELPKPDVVRCYFVDCQEPHIPAMELDWDADGPGVAERTWYLPDNVCLKGPAPTRFGITINRHGSDAYRVRVLWNHLCLTWDNLTRVQVMSSSIAIVLTALGTDLWYLLSQSVEKEPLALAA